MAGTGCAGLGLLAAPLRGQGTERPLFRFVQLNDLHLAHDDQHTYHLAREKYGAVLAALSADPPDLIVSVGDIAHGDGVERLLPDNLAAANDLRRLGRPVLPTPGNHEVLQGEGVPELEAAYAEALGHDLTTYGVVFRGILFLMVDDTGGWAAGNPVADARNALVAQLLDDTGDLPVIVATHIPLVPFREPETLAASFGFATWMLRGEGGLLEVLERHRRRVIAVLNGHLHLTGHVVVNGIHHISISGTASYPCHWADYTVYRDRISVQVHHLPAELVGELSGNLHGRTGVLYTDRDHPTHEEYVAGRADEQAFDLPLPAPLSSEPGSSLLALKANGFPAPNLMTVPVGPARTRAENLGRMARVACLPFASAPAGEVYVGSTDQRQLYLSPTGRERWTPEDLASGVPALLPARGAVVIEALVGRPADERERIETGPLLARERQESLAPEGSRSRLGGRIWPDRDYLIDVLPDELADLRPVPKACHQQEYALKVDRPSRVYAVFLPYQGALPTRDEIRGLGWQLYCERAFNGLPYPRNQAGGEAGFDIFVRNLEPGETILTEPRHGDRSAWAILGIETR